MQSKRNVDKTKAFINKVKRLQIDVKRTRRSIPLTDENVLFYEKMLIMLDTRGMTTVFFDECPDLQT
jgi:hypothetical protein